MNCVGFEGAGRADRRENCETRTEVVAQNGWRKCGTLCHGAVRVDGTSHKNVGIDVNRNENRLRTIDCYQGTVTAINSNGIVIDVKYFASNDDGLVRKRTETSCSHEWTGDFRWCIHLGAEY